VGEHLLAGLGFQRLRQLDGKAALLISAREELEPVPLPVDHQPHAKRRQWVNLNFERVGIDVNSLSLLLALFECG
jgi:hypothetical protein